MKLSYSAAQTLDKHPDLVYYERRKRESKYKQPHIPCHHASAEKLHKEGDLGNNDLSDYSESKGKYHYLIVKMIEAEDGAVGITHSDSMEKL